MQKIEKDPFTYVNVVCEAKLNPTEKRENVENILLKFINGEIITDERIDGTFLLINAEGTSALQILHEWIATQRIIDTVRSRLFRSIANNVTAVYFNRQAAFMNHLSVVDHDDGIPLGPIAFNIISDNLEEIIDIVAPKTYDGRIMSEDELAKYKARIEKRKNRKSELQDKASSRDEEYLKDL